MNLKLNFVLSLTLLALIIPTAYAQLPILVWSHTTYPSDTLDIAISKDGQYVAAVGKFWSDKWGAPSARSDSAVEPVEHRFGH